MHLSEPIWIESDRGEYSVFELTQHETSFLWIVLSLSVYMGWYVLILKTAQKQQILPPKHAAFERLLKYEIIWLHVAQEILCSLYL